MSAVAARFDVPDMHAIVGTHDVVLVTLDTLRYDVAQAAHERGETPVLSAHLPASGWERRHTPGSFTYAAHQAFFAGFLPTPVAPGPHPRLFALAFDGSETTIERTFVFDDAATIVDGFGAIGYHTICIGGVGFFNLRNALGRALPAAFQERHWRPEFGVTARASTDAQVALAVERLESTDLAGRRVFLFVNVSALHQPNRHYADAAADGLETHAAALRYVDGALAPLFAALRRRGPAFVVACSDHGTAYGEDGYRGHRLAHDVVMHVPYAHFVL
ncbi:MAG TPA: STM4013/SEN3800 family hydrolase [Xanthomonadales bacterium]|nr:STM4013/SEN3800 family hydrolase [Xanthomonadales bacterium]